MKVATRKQGQNCIANTTIIWQANDKMLKNKMLYDKPKTNITSIKVKAQLNNKWSSTVSLQPNSMPISILQPTSILNFLKTDILKVMYHTWLHCEESWCICWTMRAILCSISSNWLSLSFMSSKHASFSSILAKEAFSCATSLSLASLNCTWLSVRAVLLLLRALGLGPNPTPRIRPLRSLPIRHEIVPSRCAWLDAKLCIGRA